MPAAILDLEIEQLPRRIDGLQRYRKALALFRFRGRPVGQAWLPVVDGVISGAALRDAVRALDAWPFWREWLRHELDLTPGPPPGPPLPQATIAICTRDRPHDLERCLTAVMRLPDDGQEVLVVDNAPATEATRRLVARFERVRYVCEVRPGLDVARNRALREACGDIIAFNDDDATPDPAWLRALLADFDDPLVLCVTGLTMPLELESPAQERFERLTPFGRGFARKVFDSTTLHPLVVWPAGAGANMALRRLVLDLVGPFDEALDAGTSTRSGGDHDMFARILAAGYRIVYEPAALSWHRHRRTWDELRQTIFDYGVGSYALWTKQLLRDGETTVVKAAWNRLSRQQLPMLARSLLRRPGSVPLDLVLAEFRGCATGPVAYLASRRRRALRGGHP